VDLEAFIARSRTALNDARTGDEVRLIGRTLARRTLLAAAGLASIVAETWTTDRATGVQILKEYFPDQAQSAEAALTWTVEPSTDADTVRLELAPFADWVAHELRGRAELPSA
jgi:hypothetical protein